MKYILLTILLISCTKHTSEKIEVNELSTAINYCERIKDPAKDLSRCDRLTFVGLFDTYCPINDVDIFDYEYSLEENNNVKYKTGQLHRDVEPCYNNDLNGDGNSDSRSEISPEGVISYLHSINRHKELNAINRFLIYANDNNWTLGEGPKEYTFVPHLSLVSYKIKANLEKLNKLSEDSEPDITDKLRGYRANVIASYLELKGCTYGYLNRLEKDLLVGIYDTNDNPILGALYSKYIDANESSKVKEKLSKFNKENLPIEPDDMFTWGDMPAYLGYIFTVGILDGRCGNYD